jgi:5-methylcytosine-specific restriction protein A
LRTAHDQAHDAQRGTAAQRGYDSRWQRRRAVFLRQHPYCAACLAEGRVEVATDVHHLRKRKDGGGDEDANLLSLCHACHSRITAAGG